MAALAAATVFTGCQDDETVIPLESVTAESLAEETTVAPDSDAAKDDPGEPEKNVRSVRVYVCGAVGKPDVYCIDGDVRVTDAVDAAGGFTADAGTDYLNLAEPVKDGQKIYIPTRVEIEEALESGEELYGSVVNITTNAPGVGTNTDIAEKSADPSSGSEGLVDINSADKSTLMTLPGIGESKADKIIAYREQNGGFSAIEDIMLVGGIKEGLFNKVKDSICVR